MKKNKKKSTKERNNTSSSNYVSELNNKKNFNTNENYLSIFLILTTFIIIGIGIFFVFNKILPVYNKKVLKVYDIRAEQGNLVSGKHLYTLHPHKPIVKIFTKIKAKYIATIKLKNTAKWVEETKDGETLILEKNSNVLLRYKKDKFLGEIFIPELRNALNFVVDDINNIYVPDIKTNLIYKYSFDGSLISKFPEDNSGKINRLFKIFRDIKNNIYAIDINYPFSIKIFNKDGKFIRKFIIKNLKQIHPSTNLVITHDGNIYMNDFPNGRILVFNPKGKKLCEIYGKDLKEYDFGLPGQFSGGLDNLIYINRFTYSPIKF